MYNLLLFGFWVEICLKLNKIWKYYKYVYIYIYICNINKLIFDVLFINVIYIKMVIYIFLNELFVNFL